MHQSTTQHENKTVTCTSLTLNFDTPNLKAKSVKDQKLSQRIPAVKFKDSSTMDKAVVSFMTEITQCAILAALPFLYGEGVVEGALAAS